MHLKPGRRKIPMAKNRERTWEKELSQMDGELDFGDADTIQMESEPSTDEIRAVDIQQSSNRTIEYYKHSLDALEVGFDNPYIYIRMI